MREPGRVLIIKPSAIGDVVHALPILALMRDAWPKSHISWVVTPACAGLLEGHPLLDEVVLFDRKKFGRGYKSLGALAGLGGFLWSLRGRFELVMDLQGLFRSGFISYATGARERVGMAYAREGAPWFYTTRVAARGGEGEGERHALERYLDVAEAMGLPRGPVRFVFNTREEDRERVRGMCPAGRFALVFPGTNWETKPWPAERFAALVRLMREELGLACVMGGGPGDAGLAETIGPDVSLAGRTTLRETTALIEQASVVIANDSGPMHIAAALGKPLVALYGPTSHVRTGPYQRGDAVLRLEIPCAPCLSRTCSHRSCLRWLGELDVLAKVREQIARGVQG